MKNNSIQIRIIKFILHLLSPKNSFLDAHALIAGLIASEAIEDTVLLVLYNDFPGVEDMYFVILYSWFTCLFAFVSLICTKLRKISIFFIVVFFSSYFICKFLNILHPLLDQHMYGIYAYLLLISLLIKTKIIQANEWNH